MEDRVIRPGALAALVLLAGGALCDVDVWSSVGPYGGTVFALAIDPHAPATVYAGTGGGALKFTSGSGGAIFKTTNGGASWQPASAGLPPDSFIALAIDPVASATVYAGTKHSGVYKSTDGGATWTPPAARLATARVYALVIDPVTPATLYAATDTGVYKSTDGAATWSAATAGIGSLLVYSLAIDPTNPSTLYAGTQNNGVFKSVDGAATWTAASSGLTGNATRVFALAVDPKTPSTLYAGTNGSGVFKSTDGAATWKAAAFAGTNFALAIDPLTPTTVYACANAVQVAKSLDGGATLNRVVGGFPNQTINALAIDPVTPSTFYIGTANGVLKSTNAGLNAQAMNTGLASTKIFALAIDPAAPATVYAGTDLGLYKSTDGGASWKLFPVSPNVVRVFSLFLLPGSAALLAGTDDGGWRSTDGGATWTHLIDTLGIIPFAWTVDPTSPGTVYAAGGFGMTGPTQGGAAKSTDSGATWMSYGDSNNPLPVFESIAFNPSAGSTAAVGTDSGVYGIFIHGGGRYEWVTNSALAGKIVWTLTRDPASDTTFFAGTDASGLYKSGDGGVTWASVLALPAKSIYAFTVDPDSPSTFYAGTNAGLFQSPDRGATWAPVPGLGSIGVNAFAIAPGSPPSLYVGTLGQGVFRFPTPPPAADFTWTGVPVAGQPFGFTDLSTGNPTSWSWTFGDGGASTQPYPTHTFAAASSYQVSLTVTNAAGSSTKTQTVTVSPAVTGSTVTKVVPIVLDVSGVGGARFSSELTLANRGTSSATLQITYVAATSLGASGSGTVGETLGPGRQMIIPDTLAYLRGKGLTIPSGSNQGGALFVTFEGLSSDTVAFAGARTTAPSAGGRAGLAYPAVRLDDALTGLVYLFGLRENAADRSNLALVNLNTAAPTVLRVTLYEGADLRFTVLPNVVLGPGQWTQLGRVLAGPGYADGWATIEIVSGPGPFYAYAVFNDNVTSDGSFVPPMPLSPGNPQTLSVLVETGTFQSELVLGSPYAQPITLTMTYVESLSPAGGAGGVAMESLQPYEQKIIPNALDYLRSKGVAIGPRGAGSYAGALQISALRNGSLAWLFVGARTGAPAAGGGQYGLFYRATQVSEAASGEAWVFGLQQNATNRSNLAVVNFGNVNVTDAYRVDVYDGDTGKLAGSSAVQNLPAGGWNQFSPILAAYGVANGYVHVVKTGGSSALYAYGVVNDGATPGSGATNDGSFVAHANR
jgi:PKD repeat protein/photosystem II stability/assembly factor-like uncharacterized protein